MSDPWLRGSDGAWIPSPQAQGVHILCVSDLMVPNVKVWDKCRIESIFLMHIAKCIFEILLFDNIENDKLVWMDNTNGFYSVKSGYKTMLNVTGKLHEVSQHESWHDLWHISAPPKAKHLLWRIIQSCLPTRLRLHEKRVPCPLLCPLCNQEDEDEWHIFFTCEASAHARYYAGLDNILVPRV
jgi:hypothetical protein